MAAVSFTRDIPTRSLLAGNVGHLTAFEHIQSITVGSLGASSVTFSEIPQDYRHLQIRGTFRTARANADDNLQIQFNLDSTAANYAFHNLYGTGASAVSANNTVNSYIAASSAASSTASVFASAVIDILDYSSGVKNKTVRGLSGFDGNGSGIVYFGSALWENTAVVSSLTLVGVTNANFVQFSTFSLYGIR